MRVKKIAITMIIVFSMLYVYMPNTVYANIDVKVSVNGQYVEFNEELGVPFIDKQGRMHAPLRILAQNIGINDKDIVWDNSKSTAIITYNGIAIKVPVGERFILVDDKKVVNDTESVLKNGRVYLPIRIVMESFGYDVKWDGKNVTAIITEKKESPNNDKIIKNIVPKVLPKRYDLRELGRVTPVKYQGDIGACWAFAAIGALESAMAPTKILDLSEDNMSLRHGFSLKQNDGGDFTLALAYLTRWDGPILETDDPYGDGVTVKGNPIGHLQEARIIKDKDYEGIKKAVIKYGGVQTAVYSPIQDEGNNFGLYYNDKTSSLYNYDNNISNHDVVIVGWDDNYSAEKFLVRPKGNGAFICKNSWGTDFGDDGYYYVSYYDNNIGTNNIVYTRLESSNNYDNIYQYDKLGWVREIGYDSETAYFTNVYTAKGKEKLKAFSFYATANNTEYEAYVVPNYNEKDAFKYRKLDQKGSLVDKGYYTIDLKKEYLLEEGQKFAVIIKIKTPGNKFPIAAEYYDEKAWALNVEVNEKESFISYDGENWEDIGAKEDFKSNVCLKTFTVNYTEEKEESEEEKEAGEITKDIDDDQNTEDTNVKDKGNTNNQNQDDASKNVDTKEVIEQTDKLINKEEKPDDVGDEDEDNGQPVDKQTE